MNEIYNSYKGLQRPLELFGLKGRYISIGIGGATIALITLVVASIVSSIFIGLLLGFSIIGFTAFYISKNSSKGLYKKNIDKGIYIVTNIVNMK